MHGKRVIFYNDASAFGGHEVMSAFFANELSNTNQVTYYYSNPELKKLLSSTIKTIPLPFHSKTGTFSLPFNLNPYDIYWMRKRFQKHRTDFVIIVQGAVDISLRGAIAARLSNLLTLNYIPYHFPRNLMGLSGGWFFDSYFSWFFNLFNGIITISDHQKRLIRSFIEEKKHIYILENCVPFEDKPEDVSNNQYNGRIGWVGRLDWIQKGLKFLLDLALETKRCGMDIKFIIIGDGPERKKLKKQIIEQKLVDKFVMKGWIENRFEIYNSFDLLLITSEFEGVPLIMIESLAMQKPILARLTPGTEIFTEYLPEVFLFKTVSDAMHKLSTADVLFDRFASVVSGLRENVIRRHSKETFRENVKSVFDAIQNDFTGKRQ